MNKKQVSIRNIKLDLIADKIYDKYSTFLFSLLYLIELSWVFIDIIGGYFLHISGGQSIVNVIIRGCIFLYLLFIVFIVCRKTSTRLFIIALTLILLTSLQLFFYRDVSIISSHIKLLLFPFFLEIIKYQTTKGFLSEKQVFYIIFVNFLLVVVNILLGFFKIGYSNYGISENEIFKGSQGFIYSGNELAGTFIALSTIVLWISIYQNRNVNFYISLLLLSICSIGILSKSSIFGFGILALTTIIINKRKVIPFLLLFITIITPFIYNDLASYIELLINRITYFGELYGYDTVFLGGAKRHQEIQELLTLMANNEYLILLGTGWQGYTENNFFDLLGAFGIFGIFIILIWFEQIVYLGKSFGKNKIYAPLFIGYTLLLMISIFAGHIVQSAMVSLFAALIPNLRFLHKS